MDVVFVGAGPGNLAAAYHLARLIKKHNNEVGAGKRQGKSLGDVEIAVIEKGTTIGAHVLSGAVLDPRAIEELMPDYLEQGFPIESEVTKEDFYYLLETRGIKSPLIPPPLENHGNYIVSLNKIAEWLGERCEEAGINIFPEFPGAEMLYDERDAVIGVRTGDKGIDKEGHRKPNFEAGVDLLAKVTVLGEGPRGSLTKQLTRRLGLDKDRQPQVYSLGVKELWEVPEGNYETGKVTHTLGFPSDVETYGGGWVYGLKNNIVNIGYVTGLDYKDPLIDPHAEFQKFKTHPVISKILEGGKMIRYGAKTIAAGGWHTMPQIYTDGALLVGDCAAFLNGQRLKGIHTAMKSGMLAAETIFEALLADDYSSQQLEVYQTKVEKSWLRAELYAVRNFHSAFTNGRWMALVNGGLQFATGGRNWGVFDTSNHHAGHLAMEKLEERGYEGDDIKQRYKNLKFDNKLTFDKATNVYNAAVRHTEDQPSHLHVVDTEICATRCTIEYGNPCQRFCPAAVYEMEMNPKTERRELKINSSNCVHCKTCDIMDPYQIINWVTPEGGGGPNYKGM
ncbi:MAG: electron transfer flavoprotein-ubiquinone oxidoreductase [Pyrinomonadaceae bacterium]|nr:electron transfer flavoprotein-ubiquinone oxidoreductase [Pyrinomonadaceae bacterium]